MCRPLAQIASGGERGRIMLALKIAPALTAASASDAASASRAGPSPAATAAAAAAAAKSPSGAAGDPAVAMRISLMMAEALKEDLKDVNGISDDSAKAGGDGSSGAAADLAEPAAKSLSLAPGPPVSIFDEIDAGVSGTVGTAVGAALLRLARTGQQVLCITHLPQVAGALLRRLPRPRSPIGPFSAPAAPAVTTETPRCTFPPPSLCR